MRLLAAVLAALEWLLPVYRLPGLTPWPDLGGIAAVTVCGALTALDVALLRIRRTASESHGSHRKGPFGARRYMTRAGALFTPGSPRQPPSSWRCFWSSSRF